MRTGWPTRNGCIRSRSIWGSSGWCACFDRLDWRQPRVPVITIAGTNGKGSVAAYATAILQAAGYRVGTFTSPHLRDYRERIRIDDEKVEVAALLAAFERIEAACQGAGGEGAISLTFFEYNALAALLVFESAGLDAWVLEVGMGGRLDAVNVVDPTVAVVVSIGLDHQEFLGATLEAIAREKAGIFRAAVPAVLGSRVLPGVLEEQARALGAPLKRLGTGVRLQPPMASAGAIAARAGHSRIYRRPRSWAKSSMPMPRPRSRRSRSLCRGSQYRARPSRRVFARRSSRAVFNPSAPPASTGFSTSPTIPMRRACSPRI